MDNLSISVIIAQIINFGLLFFIFYKFLGAQIVKIIEERKRQLDNLDKSDSVVKEKIEIAEKEANELVENARNEALEIKESAEKISKNITKQKLEEAEEKANGIVDSAKRDIEKEKLSMLEEMKEKVLDLSLKINSKIFDEKDSNKEFIKKEVKLCMDKTS